MKSQIATAATAEPVTIVDALAAWQVSAPDQVALTILDDGEEAGEQATFRQLYEKAMWVSGILRQKYPAGTRVLLLLPTGLDFVHAFFGCLAAGMIAVPASYPQQSKRKSQWKRLQAIVDNSGSELIIATAKTVGLLRELRSSDGLFERCEIGDLATLAEGYDASTELGAPSRVTSISGSDLAFLQYTSGTTAVPRGVAITHENIMNNQQVIAGLMGHRRETVGVSWLPLYHDMGLSAILQMASIGIRLILMPPAAFIQKPMRWLKAISTYMAHSSGGPNFAYELVANELRSSAVEEIDLGSWEVAFCGAEPIREKTVTEFVRLASRHGLKPNVFYPCYGLAEATVAVSGIRKGDPVRYLDVGLDMLSRGALRVEHTSSEGVRKIVCCGSTRAGNEVRVVNPNTLVGCAEDEVGEIWVKGKSVGAGYWNNPDATGETFAAYTANNADGPYMRTGDLGALHGGELYVTGRAKDLIIVRGRNLYPQDIEDVVQTSVQGLRKDCGAAFAIASDLEERLVIVQEVGRTLLRSIDSGTVFKAVAAAVVEEFAVIPHEIVLVRPASIAKTSSGKVQRSLCREYYLQDRLDEVARWSADRNGDSLEAIPAHRNAPADFGPADPGMNKKHIAQRIAETVASHLKVKPEQISTTTPWAELGVDSLQAVRLTQILGETMGCKLDSTVLWECSNIDELATCVATLKSATGLAASASARGRDAAHPNASQPTPAGGAEAAVARSAAAVTQLSEDEAMALLVDEIER